MRVKELENEIVKKIDSIDIKDKIQKVKKGLESEI